MSIKLVTQASLTDCGVACVAMVTGKALDAVLRVAIKECDYSKEGPHTATDDNLFKLLDHSRVKFGKRQKVKTVEALPPLAIMETRKMPSTGNSHLVVFERTAEGDEHAIDPGWWLKRQVRSDWNRIKLDTFIPIHLNKPATKAAKSKTDAIATAQPAIEQTTPPLPKKKKPTSASKKPKATKPRTTATAEAAEENGAEPSDGTATNTAADNTPHETAGSAQEWNDVASHAPRRLAGTDRPTRPRWLHRTRPAPCPSRDSWALHGEQPRRCFWLAASCEHPPVCAG